MTYPYTKKKLLKFKENYFFSQSNYNIYLSWLQDRKSKLLVIKKISKVKKNNINEYNKLNIKNYKNTLKYKLQHIIDYSFKFKKTNKKNHYLMSRIINKFESNKIFFQNYDKNLKKITKYGYADIETYVFFAKSLIFISDPKTYLRNLSCLLKVHDLILSTNLNKLSMNELIILSETITIEIRECIKLYEKTKK